MTFQRLVQILSLAVFTGLLVLAAFPLVPVVPVDAFLRMDPLAAVGTSLSAQTLWWAAWPALIFLVLTLIMGRFFCGMICPMGTTVDAFDRIVNPSPASDDPGVIATAVCRPRIKYHVLLFILGSALCGISLVFVASPLSLITRFYGLLVYPAICLAADIGFVVLQPLAEFLNLPALVYARLPLPRYALQWVSVMMFTGIFACALLTPRFWCRYLCPAGALFALCSARPLIRRQVADTCIQCGKCRAACPMQAIGNDPFKTDFSECIVCETCVRVCPVHAITFSMGRPQLSGNCNVLPADRRQFVYSGITGIITAMLMYTGLYHLHGKPGPGTILSPSLIRPPGALPEPEFLDRCIRCGECMKACPTNTLQPIGLAAGVSGWFSPVVVPRRGPCEVQCNVCGQVCPTGAIRALPTDEKTWAKIGTAYVIRHKCLAWEFDRKCLVCDEVCPYNALEFRQIPGHSVAVPFVNENRCSGCGFCEHHCPVQAQAAIVVEPMGDIRLSRGSTREAAVDAGLSLTIRSKGTLPTIEIKKEEESGLPPGFTW